MNRQLTPTKQKIIFSGWLRKQGGNYKTLKTRWFEVRGDQIYYYRSKEDQRTLGSIPLPGNEVVRHPYDPSDPNKFKFEIVPGRGKEMRQVCSGHDTFLLIASSAVDMEQWIGVINRIIYAPFGGGMFGRYLAETIKFEKRLGGGFVPIIVEKCVEFITEKGLKEEGLFRLSGQMKDVQELKDAFNKGDNPDLSGRKEIHAVVSLLKLYLRELPEPLIPYDFFEVFLTAAKCYEMYEEDGITAVKNQLKILPPPNFNLLKYLSRFLYKVHDHASVNKMDIRNLATVFGPNILRSGSEDPQVMIDNLDSVTNLISILIKKHDLFFPQTDDEYSYTSPKQHAQAEGAAAPTDFAEASGRSSPKPPRPPLPSPYAPSSPVQAQDPWLGDTAYENKCGGEDKPDVEIDLRVQVQELESELELQQQQINSMRTQLEKESKVRDMLLIRLADEQRARQHAEDRLEKIHASMDAFCATLGNTDFRPTL